MPAAPITRAWINWQLARLPPDTPPLQRQAMRRAFYAGAAALFDLTDREKPKAAEPTEEDAALACELALELRAFRAEQAREAIPRPALPPGPAMPGADRLH